VTALVPRARRDHYVLVHPLGRGGTAETWLARREGGLFPEEVCIKRPLRHLNLSERRAFIEEARLLARLRHVNVVQLLDAQEDDAGSVFLVLELVRGADLRTLVRNLAGFGRTLRPTVVASIGTSLCRALAAAQRAMPAGMVHRDVTPHNVLVSREGEVKLADFGVARAFDRARWTRSGVVKGKTGFLSPEQLRGEVLDTRSDLFSVGVILAALLLGKHPLREPGQNFEESIAECLLGLRRKSPHLPLGLGDAVSALMAFERDDRPNSADLAARSLSAFTDEQRAIEELRQNVFEACGPVIEVTPLG